jgi:hypothetical protein
VFEFVYAKQREYSHLVTRSIWLLLLGEDTQHVFRGLLHLGKSRKMVKMRKVSTDGQIGISFLCLKRKETTLQEGTLASGKALSFCVHGRYAYEFRIAAAVNSSAWSLGSSNLANGLTAGEAVGMVLIGSFIAGLIAFICGEPGVR